MHKDKFVTIKTADFAAINVNAKAKEPEKRIPMKAKP